MRFFSLGAIALFASISMWILSASAEAQLRTLKPHVGTGKTFDHSHRGSVSAHGHSGHSHHRHGHSHHHHGHGHHHHGHGRSFFPFYGSRYYSSYTSYYSPFGGSFFYGSVSPGYGCYNSPWGYSSGIYPFPAYQYYPAPLVVPNYPYATYTQPLIDAQIEADQRWAEELKLGSHIQIPIKPVVESSAQERLRAQRLQISGDESFRKQFFSQAMHQYRRANSVAQDLPGPYFRMAVIYAVQGKYDAAVTYLKRTLELDPTWPLKGDSLTMLYGPNNSLARNALLIEVSHWVEEDIRDPDRSFLMGALLYEFDQDSAATFLETSARLSGTTRYASPYLSPVSADNPQNPAVPNQVPADQQPPDHGIPTPPLPEPDPTVPQEQSRSGPKIVPFPLPNVDFTFPRQGEVVTPIYKDPRQGPELPPLGN